MQVAPPDLNPAGDFVGMVSLWDLPDTDPRAQELFERMRQVWDTAPTIATLDGMRVRIAGYVVSLEGDREGLREFLLVPYFGACIHTPPPPGNQVIHARADPPAKGLDMMDAVQVSGTLSVQRADSDYGVSGYTLAVARVEKVKTR